MIFIKLCVGSKNCLICPWRSETVSLQMSKILRVTMENFSISLKITGKRVKGQVIKWKLIFHSSRTVFQSIFFFAPNVKFYEWKHFSFCQLRAFKWKLLLCIFPQLLLMKLIEKNQPTIWLLTLFILMIFWFYFLFYWTTESIFYGASVLIRNLWSFVDEIDFMGKCIICFTTDCLTFM